ncbi:efflux transporter outer membrane subunit [Noviherbaspirillum pedocola]|uniref:TolC family protein n=1 Tax=Noviherbaspirillum pedocola TaxID=2801341 RepID=A0A934W9L2_9BURK|nr:TolC family protein [Noviherbaspirillum pedocola]MBK4737229.1 TolC family protein [Noviherbaspirillum pedocola]
MSTRLAAKILCASVIAALTACTTVGPNYKVPDQAVVKRSDAAADFASAQAAAFSRQPLPPQWWKLYQDPELDRLIEKALGANADLRVAAANLSRSRSTLAATEAIENPALSVSASPGYGRPSAEALGIPVPIPNTWLYDVGATVSYEVDLFGKMKRVIQAAEADSESAEAAYDLARVNVAAGTARAYADACTSAARIRVAEHSVALQKEFVDVNERRIRAGRGTALDRSRATAQLEQLRAALPPLQAAQRIALQRLAVLTGETPNQLPQAAATCAAMPRLSAPVPVGDGAALLRRRPDIRQAERSLAGSVARVGVATADLYPNIGLGLQLGSTGILSEFGAANATRFTLGPLISWSIPINGVARNRVAAAQAGSEAALAHFDSVVLNALRETESALTAYARELDRNADLKAARDQSALAARQSDELYRYGRTDFLSALDARRTLAVAESTLAASDAQLVADQMTLFLALGGGWEEKEGNGRPAHGQQAARQEDSGK